MNTYGARVGVVIALLSIAASFVPVAARSSTGLSFAKYAVAADHVDASAAGAQLLAEGGNAADAAAATMLALGVASPSGSGLGGGGFGLYYRARDKSLTFLDFRESAPERTTSDLFRAREGDSKEQAAERSRVGGLAVAVPGEPLGIAELVRRFGTKPLSAIVKPAEQLARQGFRVSAHTLRMLAAPGAAFASDPLLIAVFSEPARGAARAENHALADTLRRFGEQGAQLFYSGALAKQIVRTVRAHGGILSERDLAAYRVLERAPLRATRLGYEWVSAPPPSAGGYTVTSSLALLERWLPTAAHWQSPERAHALVESWKGAYLDRQRYFGDPDHVNVPLAALASDARSAARAAIYHPGLALPGEAYALPLSEEQARAKQPEDHGTSHLCVVDEEGNVAAVTTTVNLAFGAGISVAGLWLNDEMDDFAREVGKSNAFGLVGGAPNLPGPRKRPVSSMSPTIVLRDGEPVLCVGGSGGSRIPTAVEQVALYVLHDGMHPAQAIAAPRLHHQLEPEQVDVRGVPEASVRALEARGHRVNPSDNAAQVQAIQIVRGPERALLAGSDPGKGGEPRGE